MSCRLCDVIKHVDEVNPTIVIPYMRVSRDEQRERGSLERRVACLWQDIAAKGIRVIGLGHAEQENGRLVRSAKRQTLIAAIQQAKQVQADNPDDVVAVITDCRNRFLRGRGYNGQPVTDPPSLGQLRRLELMADGIPLVTLVHPDTPFDEVRSYETMIPTRHGIHVGRQEGTGRTSHRFTTEQRQAMKAEARRLRPGSSIRQIAKDLKISEGLLRRWLKE